MATLVKLLSVAACGAIDLWSGIPIGLASGLPPVASGAAATAGEWMWDRYGILDGALQAPMLTGAPFGTLIALALGAFARKPLLWRSVGLLF